MKKVNFILAVTLSLTNLSLFTIGFAEFTIFHAVIVLFTLTVFLVFISKNILRLKAPKYLILLTAYITLINILNLNNFKFTSFVYTFVILIELLLLYSLIPKFNIKLIKKALRAIIFLYFINILITAILIHFKSLPTGFVEKIFGYYNFAGKIRPQGFSSEPSYAALIIAFTLLALLKCTNFIYDRRETIWYILAILSIILTNSSYGYLFLIIIIIYFLLKSKLISSAGLILVAGVVTLLFIAIVFFDDLTKNYAFARLSNISNLIVASDYNISKIVKNLSLVDGSASYRVLPTMGLIEQYSSMPLSNLLLGYGAGSSTIFFTSFYNGNLTLLGFIPAFVYNYGIIGTVIAFLCFLSLFPKEKALLLILFILFLFNADFNTQIFLFVLFIIMICNQIEKLYKEGIHAKD